MTTSLLPNFTFVVADADSATSAPIAPPVTPSRRMMAGMIPDTALVCASAQVRLVTSARWWPRFCSAIAAQIAL